MESTPVKDKAVAAREDLAALTPSPSMRSPRSAALLPGAARVLPPIGGKDDGYGSPAPPPPPPPPPPRVSYKMNDVSLLFDGFLMSR